MADKELLKRLFGRMRREQLKNVVGLVAVVVVLAVIWRWGWDLVDMFEDIFDSDWERPTPVETLPTAPFN